MRKPADNLRVSGFQARLREYLFAYALIFTFLFVTHAPLLRLPYFWDEAGYFIPAARDLLLIGSLIPHTTLSNAHPPLVMLWLAFWCARSLTHRVADSAHHALQRTSSAGDAVVGVLVEVQRLHASGNAHLHVADRLVCPAGVVAALPRCGQ